MMGSEQLFKGLAFVHFFILVFCFYNEQVHYFLTSFTLKKQKRFIMHPTVWGDAASRVGRCAQLCGTMRPAV